MADKKKAKKLGRSANENIRQKLEFKVPEFIAYQRSIWWFVAFFSAFAIVLVITISIHDIFLAVMILLGAIVFYQLALAHPQEKIFSCEPHGITFNNKSYLWSQFKSFSVYENNDNMVLHLEPLSFAMNTLLIPIPKNSHRSELIHLLRTILPESLNPKATFGDWLIRITRF